MASRTHRADALDVMPYDTCDTCPKVAVILSQPTNKYSTWARCALDKPGPSAIRKAGRVQKAPPARRNSRRLIERAYVARRLSSGHAVHAGRHLAGTFEWREASTQNPKRQNPKKNCPPARARNPLKSSVKIVVPGSRPDTDRRSLPRYARACARQGAPQYHRGTP
jgi:hypothetical protein